MNKRIWIRAGIIFAVGVVIMVLYDVVLNGIFVDWFYANFMIEYSSDYITPDWEKLKQLFLIFLLVIVPLLYIGIHYLVNNLRMKECQKVKDEILYLLKNDTDEKIGKYPEIETEILKMRMDMNAQRRLYEKEAAQKNDLITYLAHDLKTPLASVVGYLSFLDEANDIPQEHREKYTRIALDKAYRLEALIDQFFDITRFNIQTIMVQYEKADLALMMQQLQEEFYPLAKKQNRMLSFVVEDTMDIYVDPDKFGRVLNNVMKNALAYSYENSTIRVKEYCENDIVTIEIQNEGNPIPEHKLSMIFEKFYRLDDARNTSKGGAGLGLAIAKEIMKAHHGDIQAKSDAQHTTFLITLPIRPYDSINEIES